MSFFEDNMSSKPTNRYRVKPVVNGEELDTLKVEYSRRYKEELDTEKIYVINMYHRYGARSV
jgi:hypothetical protein